MVKARELCRYPWLAAWMVRGRIGDARHERGAAMAEYGLLLLLVVMAAFAMVALFGAAVLDLFVSTHDEFTDARAQQGA